VGAQVIAMYERRPARHAAPQSGGAAS